MVVYIYTVNELLQSAVQNLSSPFSMLYISLKVTPENLEAHQGILLRWLNILHLPVFGISSLTSSPVALAENKGLGHVFIII